MAFRTTVPIETDEGKAVIVVVGVYATKGRANVSMEFSTSSEPWDPAGPALDRAGPRPDRCGPLAGGCRPGVICSGPHRPLTVELSSGSSRPPHDAWSISS